MSIESPRGEAGRATQGVKLINIKDGDSIASVSVVTKSDEEEEGEPIIGTRASEESNTQNEAQLNENEQ